MSASPKDESPTPSRDFIREIIESDLEAGTHQGRVVTRFPPEPNGYLHIGHAKSICLNFGVARQYGGRCHLRFDDTNPITEEEEYERSIIEDIRWLGFDWGEHLYHASDYFDRLYAYAEELTEKGLAYVCSLDEEAMRDYRGTVTEAGRPSPDRDRPPEESLDLLRRMRAGELPDGALTLRARIDMASPNMKMRDPPLYRIRHATHHRTGDAWCIYPMYDFAHCLSDSIESITHSICTLEFENNRELYDWILDNVDVERPQPRQYEFARLNLTYTVMSKRKLLELVREGRVRGWDDPRMPTLAGMRRRGITPEAIRAFADMIGVAKTNSRVDLEKLDYCIRDDLNHRAPRAMGVIDPLRVTVTNYPEGETEWFDCPCWPHDVPREGSRRVPFGRELYIEREDFQESPPRGFRRLAPGREVRLRYAYFIRCDEVVKDDRGEVVELRCTYDPDTRGGNAPDGRKVSGTLHWVSAEHALEAEVRLYDRLFTDPTPDSSPDIDFHDFLNPESLKVVPARLEPSLSEATGGTHFQLERLGYFFVDPVDSAPGAPVLNRTVPLRDSWSRPAAVAPAPAAEPDPSSPPPPEKAPLTADAVRLRDRYALGDEEARTLTNDTGVARFFEAAAAGAPPDAVARWIAHELLGRLDGRPVDALPFGPEGLAELVALVEDGTLSGRSGKDVLDRMLAGEGSARTLVESLGLQQLSDEAALAELVEKVLASNPTQVETYRAGKRGLLGFFVGQVMRDSGGRANAETVKALLQARLDG